MTGRKVDGLASTNGAAKYSAKSQNQREGGLQNPPLGSQHRQLAKQQSTYGVEPPSVECPDCGSQSWRAVFRRRHNSKEGYRLERVQRWLCECGYRLPGVAAVKVYEDPGSNPTMGIVDVRRKEFRCPECGSKRIWKDGLRSTWQGSVQRWICRDCGYRFSHLDHSEGSECHQRIHTKTVYRPVDKPLVCRVGAADGAVVNLAEMQGTRNEIAQRESTKLDQATVKGKIIEFAFWLTKQGIDEETAKNRAYILRRLVDLGVDLWQPETIKDLLAKQKTWNDGYKMIITYAYQSFLSMEGLSWKRPKYKQPETLPFIPTEVELDLLINGCGKKLSVFLKGLKDTGVDPGELGTLRWIDLNNESRTVNIRPVKNHNPRILQVSKEFINMLERLPKKSERIFTLPSLKASLTQQRKRLAYKFANPRLLKISFTTFRHWKGTMEYHRTRDILYVQKLLGHKHIKNTMKYIDLENAIFQTANDEFFVKVATNVKEACKLIEAGFEYVTGEYNDGGKIFRKRK